VRARTAGPTEDRHALVEREADVRARLDEQHVAGRDGGDGRADLVEVRRSVVVHGPRAQGERRAAGEQQREHVPGSRSRSRNRRSGRTPGSCTAFYARSGK
jgi:hypothetical protein